MADLFPYRLPLNAYEVTVLRKLLEDHAKGTPIHPFDLRVARELSTRLVLCPDCETQHEGQCEPIEQDRFTQPTYVVRKNGLEWIYLQKDGTFGAYKTARVFKTQDDAAKLTEPGGHGVFERSVSRRIRAPHTKITA